MSWTPTYMAFDPGPDTGWAIWDEHGMLKLHGIYHGLDNLFEELHYWTEISFQTPDVFIVEDWTTDPTVKLGGSKMEVVRAIGAIMYVARRKKLVFQSRTILPQAELIAGMKIPKGKKHKDSHDISAIVHGEYYLVTTGIKPHRLDVK